MKDKEMIRHALYDIHEYADLLLRQSFSYARIDELAELILKRVEQIREAIE